LRKIVAIQQALKKCAKIRRVVDEWKNRKSSPAVMLADIERHNGRFTTTAEIKHKEQDVLLI